ncbi:MAG: potassium/proton antiporter [Balneolaceae bacterium]
MDLTIENILLIGSLLLFISIIAGKTSYRFGVPTLVLFLVVGILAGSEGVLGIEFNDPKIAQFIGIVSLNFILFSGGLETSWPSIKPILWQGIVLSSLGVLLTALSLGVFVWYITDFTIYEGLLLGAIVSSTDAAAVFSILRSKSLALKTQLRPTLELESGSNDPMAYVLTIMFLGLVINPGMSVVSVIPIFFQQMILGGLAGILFGYTSKKIINRIHLDFEGLYPVLVISLMFFTFSFTDSIGGNGFLAVYLCAVFLGNQDIMHRKTIIKMFDGLAWLMQIVLFLTLGLLVSPSSILPILGTGILVSLFLILIARPFSVLVSLLPFKMKFRRRAYISWVGLRGAVPIVFATYPLIAGIEKAEMIFNIVFFISVTSIIIQGTSLPWVAKLLHVSLPVKAKPKKALDVFLSDEAKTALEEIIITDSSPMVDKMIVDLDFPDTAIIAMIKRGEQFITPSGSTILKGGDQLMVLSDSKEGIQKVYDSLGVKRVA